MHSGLMGEDLIFSPNLQVVKLRDTEKTQTLAQVMQLSTLREV